MKIKQAGLSLLECMIVLAVFGIALASAAVDLPVIRERRLIRAEAESIRLTLEQAAILSVASLQGVDVEVKSSSISVRYLGGRELIARQLAPSLSLASQGRSREVLTFYPTISATPATLILKSRTLSCSIVVSLRTRVTATC
jgi:prepilin-type N-terminal cleavage/methylation domain-containing protein